MPRPKKTEAEILTMREKIIDATLAILKEKGPDAVSSRAIGQRLGMSHMSLFTYFKNQEAILAAVRDHLLSNWLKQWEKIEERAQGEDIPPLVEELLNILVTYAQDNPNMYRMGWVMPEKESRPLSKYQERKLIAAEHLAHLLETGMERGDFEARDPLLAASTVLGMVNMPFILFHNGRINDPEFLDQMVDEVLSAVMLYLSSSQQENE